MNLVKRITGITTVFALAFTCAFCLIAISPAHMDDQRAYAAGKANVKAMMAYDAWLSKKHSDFCISWIPDGTKPSSWYFTGIDIDGNGVKELIVQPAGYIAPGWTDAGRVYTYKNGKMRKIGTYGAWSIPVKLYKKTHTLVKTGSAQGLPETHYAKILKGKLTTVATQAYSLEERMCYVKGSACSVATYNAEVAKYEKGKATKIKFHRNTKSNRAKYLK